MDLENKIYLTCTDYLVSKKPFNLIYNKELDMLETYPKPDKEQLSLYYKSENYISHTDANKSWFDKAYQSVKKINLKRKLRLLNSFKLSEKKVLDIGCGTGDFLLTCKKNGYQVCGVEPNIKANKIASDKLSSKIIKDLSAIENEKFDIITLWHVLEHVPNLEEYISQIKRLLKIDGFLIIAVPNFKSFDAMYYKQFWAAFDVPRHLWHFSKKAIQTIFAKHTFKIQKIVPMKFDAYYVSMLSEQNKYSKSNFLKAVLIGFTSNLKAIHSKEYSSLIYILKNT